MSKERPILFSGPMVRAILDRRKTQTRRVVTVSWSKGKRCAPYEPYYTDTDGVLYAADQYGDWHKALGYLRCPDGVPGDTLWVRETWRARRIKHGKRPAVLCEYRSMPHTGQILYFEGDVLPCLAKGDRWRPSIHMPRWASRITLEITDVRIERVQEISETDAKAEGVIPPGCDHPDCVGNTTTTCAMRNYRPEFAALWRELNAKPGFGWEANPWIWALTFKVVN